MEKLSRFEKTTENISQDIHRIEAKRNGVSAAFKELFFIYSQPLVRFAYHLVSDTQVAKDTVQDVFLKIWTYRLLLNPELNLKSYLYTAVKNLALKQLCHQIVKQEASERLPASGFPNNSLTIHIQNKPLEDHLILIGFLMGRRFERSSKLYRLVPA